MLSESKELAARLPGVVTSASASGEAKRWTRRKPEAGYYSSRDSEPVSRASSSSHFESGDPGTMGASRLPVKGGRVPFG
jgi:hypothetical protein